MTSHCIERNQQFQTQAISNANLRYASQGQRYDSIDSMKSGHRHCSIFLQ